MLKYKMWEPFRVESRHLFAVPALFLEGIFMGNVGSMGLMGDMVTIFLVIF